MRIVFDTNVLIASLISRGFCHELLEHCVLSHTLIMASLDNGMSLLNVRDFMQDIIKGSILVVAVGLDMMGRKQ